MKKHDLFLLPMKCTANSVDHGATHISAMALDGIDQQVVLIDSVSKRYSMCGARVGALVTKNSELYDAVLKFAQRAAHLRTDRLGRSLEDTSILFHGT